MTIYRLQNLTPQIHAESWIAPNATVIGDVRIQRNASVWWNAVLRGDNDPITVGENTNVQDGSVLHTDAGVPLTIGSMCVIGHKVMLHGCTIGDHTLIGMGSIILNRAMIGKYSIVGANSLVPEGRSFPDGVLIMGSPAKVARELRPDEIAMLEYSADHYVQNWKRYKAELTVIKESTS